VHLRVGCEFVHQLAAPVHAVLQVEPRLDGDFRIADERWDNEPLLPSARFVDSFGNLCRRLSLPAGRSVLRYDAVVEKSGDLDPIDTAARELSPSELPHEALEFTLPSRLCPSDELGDAAWDLFGKMPPGWARVQAIVDWVHDGVTFTHGASTSITTASDVFKSKTGVCRDFAHLSVTLCRAMNIPARYAFGYLPDIGVEEPYDPMDFCAWTEVYLEDRWWTFDPRVNQRRVGRVLIGRGRDALDVAMVTTFGPAPLESMTVWADEMET
jgi:transglutaminase-like putative cysteine protease